jgi:hypothetical protein
MPNDFKPYGLLRCVWLDGPLSFMLYVLVKTFLKLVETLMSVKVWVLIATFTAARVMLTEATLLLEDGTIGEETFSNVVSSIQYVLIGIIVPVVTMREIFKIGRVFGKDGPVRRVVSKVGPYVGPIASDVADGQNLRPKRERRSPGSGSSPSSGAIYDDAIDEDLRQGTD